MRRAKERKRVELGPVGCFEIGLAVFDGPAFNGRHVVRLLCREDAPRHVAMEVDGVFHRFATQRGARAVLMRRTARAVSSSEFRVSRDQP